MRRRPSEDDIRTTYRATVDDLYDFVVRRCRGDVDLAEDITQETWLRAVDDWERNGLPDRPAAWLARVAGRLLSNHRRHAEKLRAAGKSSDVDLLRAQLSVKEIELELQRISVRLRAVK